MANSLTALSMGKNHRLYVGSAADSATDSAFTRILNQNTITGDWKSDNDTLSTKELGKITLPEGDESYEIKGTADIILADPALVNLIKARNQIWPYQIRELLAEDGTEVVVFEGFFIVSTLTWKMDVKGAKSVDFTMSNFGKIDINTPGRPVTISQGA